MSTKQRTFFFFNRPARTFVRSDLPRSVRRGKHELDADVLTVLTKHRVREFRAAVPAESLDALAGRNHGQHDEHRKGVHRASLAILEHHLLFNWFAGQRT